MGEDIKILINQPKSVSPVEEKPGKIALVFYENLDFWLRFSAASQKVIQI